MVRVRTFTSGLAKCLASTAAAVVLAGGVSFSSNASDVFAADPGGYVYTVQDNFNVEYCNYLGTGFDRLLSVYGPWVNASRPQYAIWWVRIFNSSTGQVIPVGGGDANGWLYIGGQSVNVGWTPLTDSSTHLRYHSFGVSGASPIRAQIHVELFDGSTPNSFTTYIPVQYMTLAAGQPIGIKPACGGF
jgi:hypothetical protein